MNLARSGNSQLLSLLHAAHQTPEDNTPRFILADWLEDHGNPERAEFIRLQCHLGPGSQGLDEKVTKELEARRRYLLTYHGGGWLGPLWQWWLAPRVWHRGLLAVQIPRHLDAPGMNEILPWIDTAFFRIDSSRNLQRSVSFLSRMQINHLILHLRVQLPEEVVLQELGIVSESPGLRTLSFDWLSRPIRKPSISDDRHKSEPAVSNAFLSRLLSECPLTRHLTHLASAVPFSDDQSNVIRSFQVEPWYAEELLWMHQVHPSSFQEIVSWSKPKSKEMNW